MLKNLNYPFFTIETTSFIASEDLKNLRKFYAPILGSNAIVLYEYLRDLAISGDQGSGFHDYDSITYMLKMNINELNDARIKLEAVSLLETHIDDLNRKTLFALEKPLDKKGIRLNSILANKLMKIIGKQNYDRLIGFDQQKLFRRAGRLYEITASYEDVFDTEEDLSLVEFINKPNNNPVDTVEISLSTQEKIDLNTFEFPNIYEAILKTDSRVFFSQIQGQIATTKIVDLIKEARTAGFSDPCINLVFYYANEMSGKIDFRYVNKIIKDLIKKELFVFEPLEKYLDSLMKNTKNFVVTKKDLYKATYYNLLEKAESIENY